MTTLEANRIAPAEAAFRAGNFALAAAEAERLLATDPEHAHAWLILGASALARRRHTEALAHTDRAIALWSPAAPAALWHNRGIALAGLGRLDEAIPALAQAVERIPNHRQYRTSLAMVLHGAGDRPSAWNVALGAAGAPENVVAAAIAYEAGDLDACRRIVEMTRAGFEAELNDGLNLAQWRELRTYRGYLERLVAHPRDDGTCESAEPLYIVGDSHSLSPAHTAVRFEGHRWIVQPRLVFGLKAWHLARHRRGEPNLYAAAFLRALDALPEQATAILSAGEIDCRLDEGFLPVLVRAGDTSPGAMRALIEPVMRNALGGAVEAATERGIALHVANVPAPCRDRAGSPEQLHLLAEVIRTVNEVTADAALDAGVGVIDLYGASVAADGFARPGVHLDEVHLLPELFAEAFAPAEPTA